MVTIALAGATTGFGLTVLRNLLAHNPSNHKIVLLSRTPNPSFSAQGVDVRPVDYTSNTQLVNALHDVHTVLSFIGGSPNALLNAQLALITAAKQAGIKRFAPSEYAGSTYTGIDLYASKAVVWNAVKSSGMQYTRFACGIFMNLLATGTPKDPSSLSSPYATGEEEALAGLRPWNFVLNMKAGTADFPADGTAAIVLTEMNDVARFTVAALDLGVWPEELGMRGEITSFREVLDVVEGAQGRKFLVRENSVDEMEMSDDFYNQVRVRIAEGWGVVGDELNIDFPAIKPVRVQEFVEKWWSGVSGLGEPAWVEIVTFGEEDMSR